MTILPRLALRALRTGLACLLGALLLVACGPGSGGTGTGPIAGVQGSLPPFYLGGGGAIGLSLEAAHVQLDFSCAHFDFEGAWQTDEKGFVSLAGTFRAAPSSDPAPAVLQLQFDDSFETVDVRVIDATGALLGEAVLTQVPELPSRVPGCQ